MPDFFQYGSGLLLSWTALFLGLISPGPSVLAILSVSMGNDRRAALAMAFGVAMGTTTLAIITVTGLSALIAASAQAFVLIKILGGCYLLYLGFKSFRAASQKQDMTIRKVQQNNKPCYRYFIQGLMIHLTNPKAIFVWLAIAALGVQADAPLWVPVLLVAGACLMSCCINGLYALIFSTSWMYKRYLRARRPIQTLLGMFFCFAGFRLLLSRV